MSTARRAHCPDAQALRGQRWKIPPLAVIVICALASITEAVQK
jgi:hypothetical protein